MRTHPNHRRFRSALVATLAAGLLTTACGVGRMSALVIGNTIDVTMTGTAHMQ
ncbi:MAG: hypothetical protein ABIP17_11525 [Ilumatobacteraceae bacterium]